jgi:hypothetical protein
MERVTTERTLVFGCLHTPFQHKKSWDAVLSFISYYKPQRIIANGDMHDLYTVSRWFKNPTRVDSLQDEIDAGRDANLALRKAAGKNTEIIMNFGNHEFRWDSYISENAPMFRSLRDLKFEEAFGLNAAKIIPNRGKQGKYARYNLGPIQVGHFEVARDSAATEKSLFIAKGTNIVASHSHRKGQYFHTNADGTTYNAVGTGCLCDPDQQEYVEDPNWQHGFVLVENIVGKKRFHIHDITLTGGEVVYDGKLF